MLADWYFIGIFLALSPIFPLAPVVINRVLGPQRPNPIKQQTYECGIETVGDTWVQFKVQYYIYALVFVVFDIEAVFLFPIAAAFGQLDFFCHWRGSDFYHPPRRWSGLRMEPGCAGVGVSGCK